VEFLMTTLLLIALAFMVLAVHGWLEVCLESSIRVYDPEIGFHSQNGPTIKLPPGEFFGKAAPFLMTSMGLTLLLCSLEAGLILLALAAVLTLYGVLRAAHWREHSR
jgi:hypothetical protein